MKDLIKDNVYKIILGTTMVLVAILGISAMGPLENFLLDHHELIDSGERVTLTDELEDIRNCRIVH